MDDQNLQSGVTSQQDVPPSQNLDPVVNQLNEKIKGLEGIANSLTKKAENQETYMLLGFFILAVMVVTLLIQSFNNSQEAFQDLKNQVLIQSTKTDLLISNFQSNPKNSQ